MKLERKTFEEYFSRVAIALRAREANFARGQPAKLNQLDETTDLELMTKWAWRSAIVGAIVAFAGLPLAMMVLHKLLPFFLVQFLHLVTIICMALVCAIFGLAAYLTFGRQHSQ